VNTNIAKGIKAVLMNYIIINVRVALLISEVKVECFSNLEVYLISALSNKLTMRIKSEHRNDRK